MSTFKSNYIGRVENFNKCRPYNSIETANTINLQILCFVPHPFTIDELCLIHAPIMAEEAGLIYDICSVHQFHVRFVWFLFEAHLIVNRFDDVTHECLKLKQNLARYFCLHFNFSFPFFIFFFISLVYGSLYFVCA